MYNTPLGVRVLQGAERTFFIESLGMIVDYMRSGDYGVGVTVFDDLQRNQKIAILHIVARALLCGDEPPPELTAVLEGAVAVVYQHAREVLFMELEERGEITDEEAVWIKEHFGEIRNEELPTWRERVLDACGELQVGGDLPNADDEDRETWDVLVSCLEDCVLWDTDWGLQAVMDVDPDRGRQAKAELGIDDDYFAAISPDPSDEETDRLLVELIQLTADCRNPG
jgi:hypothetical protein